MNRGKDNKTVAIVTGGATGMGYAIAKKFIENNVTTCIIGRNQDKLDAAREQLGSYCIPISFDVTKWDKIPELVENITAEHGAIDVLVNNAGIHLKKGLFEVNDDEFQRVISTNLVSVFTMSREISKKMIERKKGSIINISSMAAHYGIPKVIAYTASKAGVEGMTRALAVELSPNGIRVNCIAPGFIKTDMSSSALDSDPERKSKVFSRTPMGKLGEPIDVANLAYFLITDESSFMTGAVIPVDGGNLIGF